ncbi:drug/metabolite transporter (DMT)-like permease [Enterococcus sp. PF1-24]|uniref:DMT family transporter n=1 Tax=unclassified Enterococcus TaxID=2608891 RepID=UPI002473973B|nr:MULTISPECIES: DMT family transporter [unclassified Enterococcus]MDH6364096.1 drug/metabolite transporter (DMT)-like permease [Enterococcus sp. PFB1-1]MDH6401197.1 drug/metabolite transporter (DMT)-like permease [Enterococcus sp. PF1-24]
MDVSKKNNPAFSAKQKMTSSFTRQGILCGFISAITFGLYSTVSGYAMGLDPLATSVVSIFAAPFVASAINDTIAAIWLVIFNTIKGRFKEIGRSLAIFPGLMVILGALFGGPIANGAYLVGIASAGAAAIPISALFPMFGAIFARIFLKQDISKRVALGMGICIVGAIMISMDGGGEIGDNFVFGIICALIAAIGWGMEGVFSAFGMSMIDSNIAITIRQGVSGLVFITVVLPIFHAWGLFAEVLAAPNLLLIIAIGALFAAVSFLTWYVANSKVGVATGMSLNSTYVLWGVVFSAIFLKTSLSPMMIIGAIIITGGAIIVSMNPMDLFKKQEG